MPPSWINPNWKDDDLFLLSPPEIEATKRQVAHALGIRYRLVNPQSPWAVPVAGINAFSLDTVATYLKEYAEIKARDVGRTDEDTDETYNNRIAAWGSELSSKSSLPFAVSGVQLSWQTQ